MPSNLPYPWLRFLSELDALLPEKVEVHCIGGFVVRFFYNLMRTTEDIDYYTSIPYAVNLESLAGRGSDACWQQKSLRIRSRELEAAKAAYNHARAAYDKIVSESVA
jgi:hypothetical protein